MVDLILDLLGSQVEKGDAEFNVEKTPPIWRRNWGRKNHGKTYLLCVVQVQSTRDVYLYRQRR
jgi:hypothetical protein